MNNIELGAEELSKLLNDFYLYFETGYDFENFLKLYLEKIGLDEVYVTQKSRDGGFDLTAKRYGVEDFDDADEIDYRIQAKRNSPSSSISVTKIRELKGTMLSGQKGIFITTAKFTQEAINEAKTDSSRPIVLIDGASLIQSCIEKEIGFVYKPVFSSANLDMQFKKDKTEKKQDKSTPEHLENAIEKQISENDLRAKILRLPLSIKNSLPQDVNKVKVIFNGSIEKDCTIDKTRAYLAGVTEIYRQFELIDKDNILHRGKSAWLYSNNQLKINIERAED
jgi:restriction system protein